MKLRSLLTLALLVGSLIDSPVGARARDEATPGVLDGSSGVPCTMMVPPTCPPGFEKGGIDV